MTRSDRPQQPPAELPEPLYHGPEQVAPQAVSGLSDDAKPPQPMTISYRWELAGLKLPPGSQVAFYATATDYHGQTAKSEPRRLIVVTPEELQQRIAGRQELILAELARVLKMQRDGRGQVDGAGDPPRRAAAAGADRPGPPPGGRTQPAPGQRQLDQPHRRHPHARLHPLGRPGEQSPGQPRRPRAAWRGCWTRSAGWSASISPRSTTTWLPPPSRRRCGWKSRRSAAGATTRRRPRRCRAQAGTRTRSSRRWKRCSAG